MAHVVHRPGSFCIAVLHTRDVDRAVAFYAALHGWTALDLPGSDGDTLLQMDGNIVAGVCRASDGIDQWIPYVSVADIHTTIERAVTLDATSVETRDVDGLARTATLRDPEGARFGLWQPAPHQGAQIMETPGSIWWIEVLSDDPSCARRFYTALFDWTTRETAFEPFAAYTVFERDSTQEGGILPIGKDWGVTPHWNTIFAVEDCDATMNRACELGGSTGFVHTVPKHGRLGSAIDSNGAWTWFRGPVHATR